MKQYSDDLARYRLERRLTLRARRGGSASDLTPVEQAYQKATQLAATDPEAALAHLEALVAVYGNTSDSRNPSSDDKRAALCLDLARQQIARLKPSVERQTSEQQAAIRLQLERAEQLASTDRAAATKIFEGIVTLYAGKSWAKELVEQAQANLEELHAAAPP